MPPRIISIVNSKGGVSKTTTCVNICAGLAQLGKNVLGIDFDPQGNLTHSVIGDLDNDEKNITEAVRGKVSISTIIRRTHIVNFDIAPSGESMVDLDLQLQSEIGRELKLKSILQDDYVKKYDFVLIDNSPHVSLKTINSLAASHFFLVPVSAEYLPLVGIKNLLKIIDQIKSLNPLLSNLGFLLTMVDRREAISGDVEKILRDTFLDAVFTNSVRINTKLKACPQKRQTIFEAEKSSGKGFIDYLNISKELLKRVENRWEQ
ncbi:MAG TPA: AAA family ATPase [Waddliaceae bacterium]